MTNLLQNSIRPAASQKNEVISLAAPFPAEFRRKPDANPARNGHTDLTVAGTPRKLHAIVARNELASQHLPDRAIPAIRCRDQEDREERPRGRPLGLEMSQIVKSVCVYCGASSGTSETFINIAKELGRELAERHIRLVYGGGGIGLMGAVADATHGGRRRGDRHHPAASAAAPSSAIAA